MKVSIILPTYNRSQKLLTSIRSVLTQSYGDFELIVVDDASTEDLASLVESIADPRIRFVRRSVNGGAGAARNTGLKHASGEFIAFQDSDDLWLPNKLERQIALLVSMPAEVGAISGIKILYERDASAPNGCGRVTLAPPPEHRLLLEEDQFDRMLLTNRISVQNCLFRRACMSDMTWFDNGLRANEDWDFAIRLASRTKIYEDHEPVVIGFASQDSISSNGNASKRAAFKILIKNRKALESKPRARSLLLIDSARYFHAVGKARSSRRFLLAAVRAYPPHIWLLVRTALGKAREKVKSLKMPMTSAHDTLRASASIGGRPHSGASTR